MFQRSSIVGVWVWMEQWISKRRVQHQTWNRNENQTNIQRHHHQQQLSSNNTRTHTSIGNKQRRFDMISIYLIYYLHSRLQLRITHAAYFYSCLLLMYSAAQFIDFFDRATFNSGFFAEMYQISIFSGNMVMPFLLTAFWLNDKRLRKSVYTKAVKWISYYCLRCF